MTERQGATRRISKRTVLLVILVAASVLAAMSAALYVRRTDPARAEGVLDRLEIPANWHLAATDQKRALILLSQDTHYYLVRDTPEPVAAAARVMLSSAGFAIEGKSGLPDCSSNHEPPSTSCYLGVALSDGLWRLELVVYDRPGAAYLEAAPWFASSAKDEIVVRIVVYY